MQRRILNALPWAPAVAAVAFLIAMLVNGRVLLDSLASHADWASAPVLAELIDEAPPGSTILLGDYPWYEAFWLLRATAWLPFHHMIWQLVPFALWLAAAGLAGFSARRIVDSRWAGAIAASLVICIGIGGRGTIWSLDSHGPATFHVALVGAWLALVLTDRRWLHGVRGWLAALGLALVTAVGATDVIVAVVGVAPLVATLVVLGAWRRDWVLVRMGAFVTVVALAGSKVLDELAKNAHISWTQKKVAFVNGDQVAEHLEFLPQVLTRMASGDAFGRPIGLASAMSMGAGLLAMVAVVAVLVSSVRLFKRTVWPERFGLTPEAAPDAEAEAVTVVAERVRVAAEADGDADADAGPEPEPEPEAVRAPIDPRTVLIGGLVFWFSVIALDLVAFVFTSAAFDFTGGRYLVPGWVAVGVLIALLAVHLRLRWLGALVATVFTLASLGDFIREPNPAAGLNTPTVGLANEIERFAQANDAAYGYAAFWDAAPITWHTRFDVQVYPILGCGERNCRFYQHLIDSWYTPKQGRSFLVIDPTLPNQPLVDPNYGEPVAQTKIGPVDVYVYDHDIADQIG